MAPGYYLTICHECILAFAENQMIHTGRTPQRRVDQWTVVFSCIAGHMNLGQSFVQATGILSSYEESASWRNARRK